MTTTNPWSPESSYSESESSISKTKPPTCDTSPLALYENAKDNPLNTEKIKILPKPKSIHTKSNLEQNKN